jgi:hypothetical protein
MTEVPLLADMDGVQMSAFSAAETTWLKDRGFAVNDHGDEATVTGAMAVRIAKTENAGDNAVLHNGERLAMRAHKFSAMTMPLKQA